MFFEDDLIDFVSGDMHEICVHKKLSPNFIDRHRTELESYFVPPSLICERDFLGLDQNLQEKLHNLIMQNDFCCGWNTLIDNFSYQEMEQLYTAYTDNGYDL